MAALREKAETALPAIDAAYTLRPSGLTATDVGLSNARAAAQPAAPLLTTHPPAPGSCLSLPVEALRLKTAIELLLKAAA